MELISKLQVRSYRSICRVFIAKLILFVTCLLFFVQTGLAQETKIPESSEEIKLSFAPLVKRVAPAVVNVYASRMVRQSSPLLNDSHISKIFSKWKSKSNPRG